MRLPNPQNLQYGMARIYLYEFGDDCTEELVEYDSGYSYPVVMLKINPGCSQLTIARVVTSFMALKRVDSLWLYDSQQGGYVLLHCVTSKIANTKFIPEAELVQRAA